MATEPVQQGEHQVALKRIDVTMASDLWEERVSVIQMIQDLLRDLPNERTVEALVDVLDRLAQDPKWEVRRAVVPALVDAARPAARSVLERLMGDSNRWVRQAAERAKRRLARITTPAEKGDKRARYAFETIKDLDGKSLGKTYEAAILIAEKYYEELAGDTAHELNTYRAAMEGLLQELEHRIRNADGTNQDVMEILGKIRDRSGYMKTLVSALLEYSRDPDLDFQLQPVTPMILDALQLVREKTKASLAGQQVEEILVIPTDIELEVCRDRLVQALVNILSNAFESVAGKGERPTVQIGVGTNGADRLVLTITDTGSGMDPGQVESATKRFRSLKKKQGGIGLGLPLALKIIEREHGGRLQIESELGIGTTVAIELPLKRQGHS